jgi:hypothetical protein
MGYQIRAVKSAAQTDKQILFFAVFEWPAIADIASRFAPDECGPCKHWYGDDCYGSGLDAEQCVTLAAKLSIHLNDESISRFVRENYIDADGHVHLDIRAFVDFVEFLGTCRGFIIT